MFTGIISSLGRIEEFSKLGDHKLVISVPNDIYEAKIGASIACSGVCLTVQEKNILDGKKTLTFMVSEETINCTNFLNRKKHDFLNLEPSLKFGDELGGHMVLGHVDGVGIINKIQKIGDSWGLEIIVPEKLKSLIAKKGSITLEGIALTVNDIEDLVAKINIIPHTWEVTTLKYFKENEKVNLEVDLFARYIARILEARHL